MIEAYFDGSCKDNPGEVGSWGFVICDPWIEKKQVMYGDRITNNIAEYTGLLELLKELHLIEIYNAQIKGDSKMVCNIVNQKWGRKKGIWRPHKKHPRLKELAINCRTFLTKGNHTLSWVPREQNTIADELTKQAYIN